MNTKKILNILKNIIIDLIIILLICAIIFGFINKKKPVSVSGYYLFTVLSGSMHDTLQIGDNIIVKKTNDYNIGDIITYKKNDIYVTHRIVKIEGDYITTKGDANKTDDVPFSKDKVLGKFVYKSDILNFLIKYKLLIVILIISSVIINSFIKRTKKKVDASV